jgi:hypothetical protein
LTTPTKAGFVTRFSEFSTLSDTVIETRLADAVSEMSVDVWGSKYERGAYLLTAHYLTLDARGEGESGVVSTRTVGDVSVSFGNYLELDTKDGTFNSTRYGREYRRLQRLVSSGIMVV